MSTRAAPIPKPAPSPRGPTLAPQAATPDTSGKHRPQDRAAPSADAHGLLASAGQPISRKPTDAGYGDLVSAAATSSTPPPATPTALPKQGSVPRPTGVIELQGAAQLAPGAWGDYIKSFRGDAVAVDVKWGTLAPKTSIQLQWDADLGFVTPRGSYQPLAIMQPFFDGLPASLVPALFVHVRGGAIDGFAAPYALKHVTVGHKTALATALAQANHLAALGLVGFKLPHPVITNEIQNGHFVFGGDALPFTIANWVNGSLALHLTDDKVSFAAGADAAIVGLGAFHLEVARKDGHYEGQVNIPLKLGKASGNVLARYVNGDISVTGTIAYASEKFHGSLTVMSGDANEVRDTARGLLDPGKLLADEKVADGQTAEKPKKGQRGIGAWGQLTFTFTDWLTGTAVTILDPFGHLTIVGKIAVAKEVVLMKAPPPLKKSIPPFPLDFAARYGLPHVADVHIGFGIDLGYMAWVGPAVLTNIELGGTYSTDPKILQDFYIGGSFRISAYAGLFLSVSVKAGVTILGHDLDAVGTITGTAGLKAYAAADAKIGYREKADPVAGKKGEAYLQGHVEAAAQPVLGLGGEVAIKLSTPWWSPLSDRTWPIKLFNYEWPLDASLGIGADIDYVVGSGKLPDVKFGKVDFDASKFSDAVLDDKVPASKGAAETEKPGTWRGVTPKTPIAPPAPTPKGPPVAGGKPARAGARSTKVGRGGQTPGEVKNAPKTPDAGKRWLAGLHALAELHDRAEKRPESSAELHKSLDTIKARFGFKTLAASRQGNYWHIDAELDARAKQTVKAAPAAGDVATLPSAPVADKRHPSAESKEEVPRSLYEPAPIKLDKLTPELSKELSMTTTSKVIHANSSGSAKEATKHLLAEHPDATFDHATGKLTLPRLSASSFVGATSLAQLGRLAAAQTGVSKITLVKVGNEFSLKAEINPITSITEPFGPAGTKGGLALYRGLHFGLDWDKATLLTEIDRSLVGIPEFAPAVYDILNVPNRSTQPSIADREAAAERVRNELNRTRNVASVRAWWPSRKIFENQFYALLQRYVNSYRKFNEEIARIHLPNSGYAGLEFFRMPFISTTKKATHAARYSLGEKISLSDRAVLLRTTGVVGRVFVYVFSVDELYAQGAVNISVARAAQQIDVHPHIFHEAEVSFSGSVPGANLVDQTNVAYDDSEPKVAGRAEKLASVAQTARGGVLKWDQAD